jgi:putative endopeptidase
VRSVRLLSGLALALLLLIACAANRAPPAAAAASPAIAVPPAAAAKPPRSGLDLAARDLSVRPGDDFYRYANGDWYDGFSIPDDRASFGPFYELDELSKQRVRGIVEHAAAAHAADGTPEQQIGDYYASFLDQAGIEARGLAPAQADLARIDHASRTELARLFGLPGLPSLFDIDFPADYHTPDRYAVFVSAASLGLPDRDYYLKDDAQLKALRARYVAYIAQILELGGAQPAQAAARARAVMAFETAAARVQWPIDRRRDVDQSWNPRTKTQLLLYAPGFPWQPFFEAAGLGERQDLVLGDLTAIRDLAQLFARTPLSTLRAWLRFQYLSYNAHLLPQRFDAAHFAFYGQALRGQPQQRERWKRGVETVNEALGEQVGKLYVAQYFPPASKAQVQQLVANLVAALNVRIDAVEWMTPATKQHAHDKLAALTTKIGYPDKWRDYAGLTVRRDDLFGNARRAAQWHWNYWLARLEHPVDRGEWQMSPQEVNAYYNPSNNEIVFPAAILQPPFFDAQADVAVNYGAVGAIIGHEISHGFDDQGRKFGAHGALEDWWTPADAAAFRSRSEQLVQQYSGFEALPGLRVNGANTIGENIGDLGGLNIAHQAWRLSLHGQEAPVIDGLSGEQRFFLAWAQAWREKDRDAFLREILLSDTHSPATFRVNGPLPNMDAWYAAFDVRPGERLYREPAARVRIW